MDTTLKTGTQVIIRNRQVTARVTHHGVFAFHANALDHVMSSMTPTQMVTRVVEIYDGTGPSDLAELSILELAIIVAEAEYAK